MTRQIVSRFALRLTGAALGLFLIAGLAAPSAFALPVVEPQASEGPALWVVRDEDSTVYLFGTVHVLRPETEWRRPEIQAAFDASSELWLEISDVDDQAAALPLMQKYGISMERSLFDGLNTSDLNLISMAAGDLGVPMEALSPYRPWLAGVMLSAAPILKAGYDPQSGVEMKLTADAEAAGKDIRGLETMEQQFQILSGMPEQAQIAFLRQMLEEYDQAAEFLDGIVTDWAEGDVAGIDRTVGAEMADQSAPLYRAMLADRNADWAEQIDALMDGEGTTFIAVGAGHLAGKDSVQAYLAKRGIAAERL